MDASFFLSSVSSSRTPSGSGISISMRGSSLVFSISGSRFSSMESVVLARGFFMWVSSQARSG